MATDQQMKLLDLPEELLEIVVSNLCYHEASETRRVCKMFNKLCQKRLNKGFARVDKLHAQIQKEVKNKLPRRESERRNHQLARHVDILSAIETRLSLLGMSYMKYMDSGLCCFIPGKVLDELLSILHQLQSNDQMPRSHEFLQELRDISSMAMEHFDEKIVPGLKNKLPAVTLPFIIVINNTILFSTFPIRGPSMRTEISNLGSQLRAQSSNMQQFKKDVTEVKIGYTNNKKRITDQEKKIIQQGQYIAELEKKVNDLYQKISDISAEFLKRKEVKGEGGESSKTISHLQKEEYSPKEDNSEKNVMTETKERATRNKGLKRKHGGPYESRVKKTKS